MAAHPRSRGEHAEVIYKRFTLCGSSPLARGTSGRLFSDLEGRRLIPARAGNIAILAGLSLIMAAHPRSRGEHLQNAGAGIAEFGSSPLARGT